MIIHVHENDLHTFSIYQIDILYCTRFNVTIITVKINKRRFKLQMKFGKYLRGSRGWVGVLVNITTKYKIFLLSEDVEFSPQIYIFVSLRCYRWRLWTLPALVADRSSDV